MHDDRTLGRRQFLVISAGGSVSGIMFASCGSRSSEKSWRFLSQEEAVLLEAVADQIIPPDEFPGGRWAGVVQFIDLQLVSYYRHLQDRYRQGLRALEASSLAVQGGSFASLSVEDQKDLLQALEEDRVPAGLWTEEPSSSFFNLLLDHCMQGFYGPPRHGGNRDYVAYDMVGLDFPQVVGRVKDA